MLAENLAKLRKHFNLAQNEFAEKLDISARAYVNYERGERKPPYELLIKLLRNYNVNLNWIIANEGEMFLTEQEFATQYENVKNDILKEVRKMFKEKGL